MTHEVFNTDFLLLYTTSSKPQQFYKRTRSNTTISPAATIKPLHPHQILQNILSSGQFSHQKSAAAEEMIPATTPPEIEEVHPYSHCFISFTKAEH
ncbi:hypothetical protein AKJ16_DCAP04723 [Drosera capensis]